MNRFSVRVYGLLMDEARRVLVSDEFIRGMLITKFPGGGLEFGEGTRDCLVREFREELNLQVETGRHIYTTDFFQISAFNSSYQILSIYYEVKALEPIPDCISGAPFNFGRQHLLQYNRSGETETARWVDWEYFSEACLTLPIDKKVAEIIKAG